jgi:hypothetical protein
MVMGEFAPFTAPEILSGVQVQGSPSGGCGAPDTIRAGSPSAPGTVRPVPGEGRRRRVPCRPRSRYGPEPAARPRRAHLHALGMVLVPIVAQAPTTFSMSMSLRRVFGSVGACGRRPLRSGSRGYFEEFQVRLGFGRQIRHVRGYLPCRVIPRPARGDTGESLKARRTPRLRGAHCPDKAGCRSSWNRPG